MCLVRGIKSENSYNQFLEEPIGTFLLIYQTFNSRHPNYSIPLILFT